MTTPQNKYDLCANCGFGIEVNVQKPDVIHAEFYHEQTNGQIICYYCHHGKARNLRELHRDSLILLKSAQRINDINAIIFYKHQITKSAEALRLAGIAVREAPAEQQGSLF